MMTRQQRYESGAYARQQRQRLSTAASRYIPVCMLVALFFASCQPVVPEPEEPGRDTVTVVPSDTVTPPPAPQDSTPAEPPAPVEPKSPDLSPDVDMLFDIEAVPEITLTLSEAAWNEYLTNLDVYPQNGLYVPAAFTFRKGEQVYHRDSVGLRPRGNTSRRRPEGNYGEPHRRGGQWHHAHFGVKFTEYTSGKRFFGYDRVILKWHKDDPAYCREVFCYDLFRRFGVWTAPRASYCRLSIHIEGDSKPVYMGVYELIENPRKGWLAQRQREGHLTDTNGNLWKAAWGADLSNSDISRMGLNDDYGEVNPVYTLKTNKQSLAAAQQELHDFIAGMTPLPSGSESLHQWLEEHMDIDLFLRAYAVSVMVGMWDDYWCNQNNYFFYFDTQHRFHFVPFDYDNTLGTGLDTYGNPGTKDMLHWGSLEGDRILMRKVMSISEYRERYCSYLRQIATDPELMEPTAASARVRQMQARVRPYVYNDTGEDCVLEDRPSEWSSFPAYRLLTGGSGDGTGRESNFFRTKAANLPQ